jgi:gas vesicle protein
LPLMWNGLRAGWNIREWLFTQIADTLILSDWIKKHLRRMMMRNEDVVKVGAAFMIGGAIGAAIALLYAPQSGRETRKDLKRTARRVKNEAVDLVEDTIDRVDDFVDDTKDRVTELIDRGVELSGAARKEIIKTLEQGQKALEKQKNRVMESIGL